MYSMCHTILYLTQYRPIGHARQAPDRTDPIDASIARCIEAAETAETVIAASMAGETAVRG